MAKRAGLNKMPEVGIYESPEVNAFATGPSKNNALVAVSTGLLQKMDDEEVHGVLAHEISHVANGDMVTMALVQGVVNSFTYLVSIIVTNFIAGALRGDSERGIGDNWFIRHFIFNAVFALVAFAAYPIVAGFSRYREYRADAGGARLAGKGAMIAALEKLKGSVDEVEKSEAAFQSMKISNKSSFAEFFSTHPPLDKRIRALQAQVR
jgi:heat shock protein HtpX